MSEHVVQLSAAVRARLNTVAAHADANVHRASPALSARMPEFEPILAAIQRPDADARGGLKRLRTLAAQWSATLLPYSACREACSHCCHIGVAVSPLEAGIIAEEIGVAAKKVKRLTLETKQEASYHHPCPFLNEGGCGIYAHRPLMCRTQVNMDNDALLCELVEGASILVPYANATPLQAVYLKLSGSPLTADIRDYFPRGLSTSHASRCEVQS